MPAVGVEDGEWSHGPRERGRLRGWMLLVLLAAVLALVIALRARPGERPAIAGEHAVRTRDVKVSLPGLPAITLRKGTLYPKEDPWRAYLADERTCPGGERTDVPLEQQAQTMGCLVNYARARRHLPPLDASPLLSSSSLQKANRIIRCGEFAHSACGEDAATEVRRAGYTGAWGENLYVAEGPLGAPRVALDGWLNSADHRENLFQPAWRFQGIAVVTAGSFRDYANVTLWVNQFGDG